LCLARSLDSTYAEVARTPRKVLGERALTGNRFAFPVSPAPRFAELTSASGRSSPSPHTRQGWHPYRIDRTGINARLLANGPPGRRAKELVDQLVARPARVVGFNSPFCVPHALLRDPKFASDAGHADGAFVGWQKKPAECPL